MFNCWSSVDEVVMVVVYFVFDVVSYVSGSMLFVDGGWIVVDGLLMGFI